LTVSPNLLFCIVFVFAHVVVVVAVVVVDDVVGVVVLKDKVFDVFSLRVFESLFLS